MKINHQHRNSRDSRVVNADNIKWTCMDLHFPRHLMI